MKVDGGGGVGGVDVRMKVQEEGFEGEEMAAKQYPPTQTRPKPFTKDEIFCTKPFTGVVLSNLFTVHTRVLQLLQTSIIIFCKMDFLQNT